MIFELEPGKSNAHNQRSLGRIGTSWMFEKIHDPIHPNDTQTPMKVGWNRGLNISDSDRNPLVRKSLFSLPRHYFHQFPVMLDKTYDFKKQTRIS
jgi:hypothetical protein